MNSKQIKEWFGNSLVKDEFEFLKFTGFVLLRDWNVSGRDDCTFFYIGKVDNRFFWYICDTRVWHHDWGFMDEMTVEELPVPSKPDINK
ncbi:MAG: hypothetical protein WC677_07640 [Clostridia bacterium]|jgi:hypothetical protein